MNAEVVRIRLIQLGLRLKQLAKMADIDYDRLVKVIDGYRSARPEEIKAIAAVIGLPTSALCAKSHHKRKGASSEVPS